MSENGAFADGRGTTDLIGPIAFQVTPEVVASYSRLFGLDDVQAGLAPAGLASLYTYQVIATLPNREGAILAGQQLEFHLPPRIGGSLFTTGEIVQRYEKRGRQYMTIDLVTRDGDDEIVTTGRITRVLPGG